MALPVEVIDRLHLGREVATEVPAPLPDKRAFVMVIPQVPPLHRDRGAWNEEAWVIGTGEEAKLRDPGFISGYEVRYLLHHAKYTDTEWGWDYDHVLDDESTRIKRVFVQHEDNIEAALATWSVDAAALTKPGDFDSSLVNSPLNYYLDRRT